MVQQEFIYYFAGILTSAVVVGSSIAGTFGIFDPSVQASVKMLSLLYDVSSLYEMTYTVPDRIDIHYRGLLPDMEWRDGSTLSYSGYVLSAIQRQPGATVLMSEAGVNYPLYIKWAVHFLTPKREYATPISFLGSADSLNAYDTILANKNQFTTQGLSNRRIPTYERSNDDYGSCSTKSYIYDGKKCPDIKNKQTCLESVNIHVDVDNEDKEFTGVCSWSESAWQCRSTCGDYGTKGVCEEDTNCYWKKSADSECTDSSICNYRIPITRDYISYFAHGTTNEFIKGTDFPYEETPLINILHSFSDVCSKSPKQETLTLFPGYTIREADGRENILCMRRIISPYDNVGLGKCVDNWFPPLTKEQYENTKEDAISCCGINIRMSATCSEKYSAYKTCLNSAGDDLSEVINCVNKWEGCVIDSDGNVYIIAPKTGTGGSIIYDEEGNNVGETDLSLKDFDEDRIITITADDESSKKLLVLPPDAIADYKDCIRSSEISLSSEPSTFSASNIPQQTKDSFSDGYTNIYCYDLNEFIGKTCTNSAGEDVALKSITIETKSLNDKLNVKDEAYTSLFSVASLFSFARSLATAQASDSLESGETPQSSDKSSFANNVFVDISKSDDGGGVVMGMNIYDGREMLCKGGYARGGGKVYGFDKIPGLSAECDIITNCCRNSACTGTGKNTPLATADCSAQETSRICCITSE